MARKTNCTKSGIDYYRVTASVGFTDTGKRIRKEFYGESKKEAEALRDAYLNDIKSGLDIDMARMTVAQAMRVWLFEVKKADHDLKASSFERYECIYRLRISTSSLGSIQIGAAKSLHIQRFLNELSESGLSHTQIKGVLKLLKMFFSYATEEGYTIKNPTSRLVIPGDRPKKEEIETFTDDEIGRIKSALEGHQWRLLILLALGTGLRRGELLALQYDDIQDGLINVHASLAQPASISADGSMTRDFVLWEPKSHSSIRKVPIPNELHKEIAAHRVRQIGERLEMGMGGDPKYLFLSNESHFVNAKNFNLSYTRLLKKAGIPHKKFHALRHTYATRLILAGTPLPTVQKLMGHSDIAMTAVYAHSSMNDRAEAVQALNSLFI